MDRDWRATCAYFTRRAPLQDLRLDPFAIPLTVSLEDAAYAEVHRPLSSVSVVGCIAGGQVGV